MNEYSEEKKDNNIEILEFILSGENSSQTYAIKVQYIDEVHLVKKVTMLPCTPTFIVGIINFRGKVISVIDIRNFLGFSTTRMSSDKVSKVIVVGIDELEIGIAIDSILRYNKISLCELQKDILNMMNFKTHHFKGITKEQSIVLDIKNILRDEKIIIDEEVI
ncbi:chemotaxis protein CheW [Clostridium sp. DJ247]|uniref:chemotaxis protein CheW n=1 Tax=Clostridium sp. DJ247 TaxID=2726188 RepID=UPI001624764B|nr:chemotaxis protein CheW [Clostridium sp. DJ247]MBC2581452.1 chemotaxis protein CheW [Clostridium sp. DJ247]